MPLGSSVSGHTLVQPLSSVQVSLPPFSDVSRYSVWPSPLTNTGPTPARVATSTVTAALEVPAAVVLDDDVAVFFEELPHAARIAAAAATVAMSSRLWRDQCRVGADGLIARYSFGRHGRRPRDELRRPDLG